MTNPNDTLNSSIIADTSIIDDHLYFTEEMVYKYDWDLMDRLDFETRLFQIKTKQQDKYLNLSIVGEFGTGKSTLINALLRSDEFLVSSSLQGTTVAATIVENSSEHAILAEHNNGQQEYRAFENAEALREGLIACTTDPAIARNLYNVRIRIPSEHLATGFRIIDTPGLNANEKWHEKVTLRAIQEMSDMSVLIIDANKPLTNSFCEFVKLTLADMLDQCVFLVTRIDMIRKRERQGVLDYLKVKVAKEFSLEDPIILPYASMAVLDELYGEATELSELSHRTEEALFRYMKDKKENSQRKKLESLINDMYYSLSDKLSFLSQGYKDELELLLRSRQVDLVPFVEEQNKLRLESFRNAAAVKQTEIIDNLETFTKKEHQKVLAEIDKQPTVDALKKFTANKLNTLCVLTAQSIVNECAHECLALQALYSHEILTFHRDFQELFKDYDILKPDFSTELFDNMAFPALNASIFQAASSDLSGRLSKASKVSLGHTATGAAIGSVIAPGLGTVVGGVIGFVSGSLFSPNLAALKSSAKEKLSAPLLGCFTDVINNSAVGITSYIIDLQNSIGREISKYLNAYQAAISERISAEKKKIALVEEKISILQQDIEKVTERKQTLQNRRKDG